MSHGHWLAADGLTGTEMQASNDVSEGRELIDQIDLPEQMFRREAYNPAGDQHKPEIFSRWGLVLEVVEINILIWVREALFSMPVWRMQACCRFILEVMLVRSNKAGQDRDLIPIARETYLREVKTRERYRMPLSLAEIVIATERLITFRERTQKH